MRRVTGVEASFLAVFLLGCDGQQALQPMLGTGGSAGTGALGAAGPATSEGGADHGVAGAATTAGAEGIAGGGGTGGQDQVGQGGAAQGGAAQGGAAQGGAAANDAGTAGQGGASSEHVAAPNYQITGSWLERPVALATQPGNLEYTKIEVSSEFLAESCSIGDYNLDGQPDISSGRRWYEGPDFAAAHVFRDGHEALPRLGEPEELDTGVSDNMAGYSHDVNGDGWIDIINIAPPEANALAGPTPDLQPQQNATAYWYENPRGEIPTDGNWVKHEMHSSVRVEQHNLFDVDGDGQPEISGGCRDCEPGNTEGYYYADWTQPEAKWKYRAVTHAIEYPFGGTGKLHGLGFGDVNADGQPDLLQRAGAWIDVLSPEPNSAPCPGANCGWVRSTFYNGDTAGNRGPAHIYAFDIDGDQDADVVAADWAHGWGMAWYEQTEPLIFERHQFMGSNSEEDLALYGEVAFSQPHSMEAVDMDGDGIQDLITGKMRYAQPNGFGDPDLEGEPVLYVFRTLRDTPSTANGGSVTFEPHLVDMSDAKPGVGSQIAVGHLNLDGIVDICVATKVGLYAFLGQ